MWRTYIRQSPYIGSWYSRVEGQPGWVTRTALIAAAFAIIVPVVLLVLAAMIVGVAVFLVLAVVATLTGQWKRFIALFKRDGRKNVRVVQRD